MKTGIGIFIASFIALGASWFGLVVAPQWQLGVAKQTTVLVSGDAYPPQRTGAAELGLQVYRASGCAACHTEQARQTGTSIEVLVTSIEGPGVDGFKKFVTTLFSFPELQPFTNSIAAQMAAWKGDVPKALFVGLDRSAAEMLVKKLKGAGCKSEVRLVATGPDIARGWGQRRSVAADFLNDTPVQLGSLRAGPDLSNIGVRAGDVNAQLLHLYAPKAVVKDSSMPPFRYLFEVRKIKAAPSADALKLPGEFAPAEGYEVVPTEDARNLAAYLQSLRANQPLYEAPFTR